MFKNPEAAHVSIVSIPWVVEIQKSNENHQSVVHVFPWIVHGLYMDYASSHSHQLHPYFLLISLISMAESPKKPPFFLLKSWWITLKSPEFPWNQLPPGVFHGSRKKSSHAPPGSAAFISGKPEPSASTLLAATKRASSARQTLKQTAQSNRWGAPRVKDLAMDWFCWENLSNHGIFDHQIENVWPWENYHD